MSKVKEQSLSDKITQLLSTAPANIDSDDDIYDDTTAKVVQNDFEDNSDVETSSKFRKQNVNLLEDIDERYKGKEASRKSLYEESEESDLSGDDDQSEDFSKEKSDDEEESTSYKSGSESDNDTDEDIAEGSGESTSNLDGKITDFHHMTESVTSTQTEKGNCVRTQLKIWESLLEIRIQLQKCLVTSNKLPQYEVIEKLKTDNKLESQLQSSKSNVSNLLNKLLNLQSLMLKSYPETKKLGENDIGIESNIENEEIPSDTDEEKSESENEIDKEDLSPPNKMRKIEEYESVINDHHEKYKKYRNTVIQKWNEKTRIAVAKSNINTNSVVNQIEYVLKNRDKNIKRTQLKRSNYNIVGYKKDADKQDESEKGEESKHRAPEEYNSEIFDDDDFYHQLLRELIEYKSADITDPIQLGRQWVELQNMRSKMKRKIDTKATKGRKIRYAVHSKLLNFMAPIPDHSWTDEAKSELFSSLFGSKSIVNNPVSKKSK